ncbi:MAG: tannase/feruloyl esterase family alpha/beta hydrolase [Kordiimonadaceae bacterium]|nr:tannase/feruloyl esterase family alpha/beta hydrolase [Kordiimonadaceae bacterium]
MSTLKGLSLKFLSLCIGLGFGLSIMPAVQASDALSKASRADLAERCDALNVLNLETVGDEPSRVISTRLVIGEKATANESLYFKKRGHSQGNPMPEEPLFPDHCLVEGYSVHHVQFAMMLPLPKNWNERFMLAACDAWCGKVHKEISVPGLYYGYATITNNGGHHSRAPFDGIWAHKDVRAREYFAHKANHISAQAGKAIAEAFYGRAPKFSYITGFSKGGNAGLMAVQRYPEDFDGVFAKAPVVNYNPKNAAHFPWVAKAVYPDGKNPVIYSDKVDLLHAGVTAACDENDGLKDGVIDDPRKCTFDPIELLCKDGQSEVKSECLNMAQVEAVRKIYAKPTTKDGHVYFEYGTDRSSENDWEEAILPVRGSEDLPFAYTGAATGVRYMVTADNPGPGYDWTKFDYVASLDEVDEMSKILDPDAVDLSAFKKRGGKLIIVHGWSDAMISANMTIDWYAKVQEAMGGKAVTDEFMQLYIVPGMVHGSGGPGPFVYDAQSPLVKWVESGITPTQLMLEDMPGGHTPFRQRPSFPYPEYAKYDGKGDPTKASSFERTLD